MMIVQLSVSVHVSEMKTRTSQSNKLGNYVHYDVNFNFPMKWDEAKQQGCAVGANFGIP
jgi:hypothetical protein